MAANERNAEAARAVTDRSFTAIGESWAFVAKGYPGWANRREEIPGARIAAIVRTVVLYTGDVAFAEGFFRTTGLKADQAGDFSSTVLKREGKWRVAAVRFAPLHFEPPFHYAITPRHGRQEGWVTLFDGKSLEALAGMDGGAPPEEWSIDEGVLKLTPPAKRANGGYRGLRTRETYTSFELEFEWKIAEKGNSGVKYGLCYLTGGDGAGREYQVVDEHGDGGAINDPRERSGSLYAQIAPSQSVARPLGEFNSGRIVVRGRHAEHWLNGVKVVEYEAAFDPLDSPIVLQNHSTPVWYRNIRIRRLPER